MSNNTQLEAAFPPAVHSLRKMQQSGPTNNNGTGSKGSYEMYEPQYKSLESPEHKLTLAAGTAPGSPASSQDYTQVIGKLQRELEESKRKQLELQEMLGNLKNPLLLNKSGNMLDSSFLEASPSNESISENVKDGHIKYLQREITVLQASLYKAQGWSQRVTAAIKERDKAVDDVTRLSAEMRNLQERNIQLQKEVESLSVSLQQAHHNLEQASEQIQSQSYNSQVISQLKEEVQRQKAEIVTLKESVNRLNQENKSLKDSSSDGGCKLTANRTCSQELEHLHKVVDTLKGTVLQQRSYLLQLRHSHSDGSSKLLSAASACGVNNGMLDSDLSKFRRNSSSPKLRSPQSSVAHEQSPRPMSQPPPQAHFMRAMEGVMELPRPLPYLSGDVVHDGALSPRKKINLQDSFSASNDLQNMLGVGNGEQQRGSTKSGYTLSSANAQAYFGQQTSNNTGRLSYGFHGQSYAMDPIRSPTPGTVQQADMHPDVLIWSKDRDGSSEDINGKHNENRGWARRQWNLSSANNSAALTAAQNPVDTESDSQTQSDNGLTNTKELPRSTAAGHQETQAQYVLGSGAGQFAPHISGRATCYGNSNLNSASSQPEYINYPASNKQTFSTAVRSNKSDFLKGEVSSRSSTPTQNTYTAGPDSGRPAVPPHVPLDSSGTLRLGREQDRQCPLCNSDFSHFSIEDFQAHVLECFDDEHPPETMRPKAGSERICPMCNIHFDSAVAQEEYENHVHKHFGDLGT